MMRLRPPRSGRPDTDDGFAMITALLFIVTVAALSVALAGVVLSETKPTQTSRKAVGTVNAAESGFEVALHRLRDATNANGDGVLNKLPCTSTNPSVGTPFTGSVGPNSGTYAYTVYIRYYSTDPTGQSTSWLTSNAIACSGGSPASVPQFAYLQADGSGAAVGGGAANQGNRNLHTTYQFKTTNLNIAGGRLWENTTNPPNALCMDAGSNPVVGSNVTVQPCGAVRTVSQSWSYRADLTILFSQSAYAATSLCLTGASATTDTLLTLTACASNGTGGQTYPYQSAAAQNQEWSFDDNGKFEGAGSTGDVSGRCIAPQSSTPSAGLKLYNLACSAGGFDYMTWNPDPQLGAGPAGTATQQLVNYSEFGRCLDFTDQNPSATWLIDYPCKQAPDPTKIRWNQRLAYDTTAHTLSSQTPSGTYCLQAPATISATASNNLVTGAPCTTGSARQTWTETGAVAGDYASSYEIVNSNGLCLSLGPGLGDSYHQNFSSIILETCNGTLRQKWNAPANFIDSRLKGTVEDAGG